MRSIIAPVFALTALTLAACVTINVYFPAAAAEKAADRIIEDVWGPEGKPPAAEATKGSPQSSLGERRTGEVLVAALGATLDFVVPAAEAQADLDVSSPATRRLVASMEARHGQLEPYYASGAVGLTADGLVELRDANAVPLAERNAARKLVADENADRNALYREIAAANGNPGWEPDIRSTFAQRWIAKARSGWWYRDAAGGWKQK
ncbi:MAG: YdbL family protein [Steroidobacteraceae bacterium]|nr:YdbL family protein [Steroidobacteraceae bacterium]